MAERISLGRFDYARDDAQRRIRITAREPLQAIDLIAIIARQAREETWTYGLLYDLRAIQAITSRVDASTVADYVRHQVMRYGSRGPVALVTRHIDVVGMGQIYAFLGAKAGVSVEVFWDFDEAEKWLDQRLS